MPRRGVPDASVFIAKETGRTLGQLPDAAAISIITLAELHLGVLMARGIGYSRQAIAHTDHGPKYVRAVARIFAELVAEARRHPKRPKIMDTWIAATAVAQDVPVYTQDEDFAAIPIVSVLRV